MGILNPKPPTRAELSATFVALINVKKYGAKGDGVTDDSPAINAAIAAVKASLDLGTNGVTKYAAPSLYFPAGTYKCNTALTTIDFKYLTMTGDGIESSILHWDGTGPLISLGTYTSAGGYGGNGGPFTMRHMQIMSPANIFLNLEGTRPGIGIQDNGTGSVTLEEVKLRGFKYGFYGAYASDFDSLIRPHLSNCDVGIYLGPGSQQVKIDTPNVEYCREGIVLEGAPHGSLNDGWFVLNSYADITVEGNATARSGVPASTTYDLSWSVSDCWHETNAGNLGRVAPRIIMVQGAPPQAIKHLRIIRPFLVSGGTAASTDTFLEVNTTGANQTDSLYIQDLNLTGNHIGSIVKPTSGLGSMHVDNVTTADGSTTRPIYSTKASGRTYSDQRGNYFQGSGGSAFTEIRDNSGSSDLRTRFVQNADTSIGVQFWTGTAYTERLRFDTQNSRHYLGNALDAYIQRAAAKVVGVGADQGFRLGVFTTGTRPSASAMGKGTVIYDETLAKELISDGTAWRDAIASTVANVKDYGAKGDGVTDDSAAITAALAASKRVHFPAGTYFAAALTVATADTVITSDRAKLLKKTAGALVTITGDRVSVSGLNIDGASLNGSGYKVNGAGVLIESCTVELTGTDAPAVHVHPAGAGTGADFTLRRAKVTGEVRCENADGFKVDECDIYGSANVWAVLATTGHADYYAITRSRITVGLNVFGITPLSRNGAIMPRNGIISDNTFIMDKNCNGGLSVDACDGATVTGNTFVVVSGTPATSLLEIVASKKVIATGNSLKGNNVAPALITLNKSTDCVVAENVLEDPATNGVEVKAILGTDAAIGNIVANNQIRLTSPGAGIRYGVYLFSNSAGCVLRRNTITGNKITANATTGIRGFKIDAPSGTIADTTFALNEADTVDMAIQLVNDTNTTLRGNRWTNATTQVWRSGADSTHVVEGNSWQRVTAAPTAGYHFIGERATNAAPAVGSPKGWVCTVSGTPGTWVSEGNL